jgi:hypothetical protein
MNVYTGLLFLQGHITDASLFADDAGYATARYGNRVANARALRQPWARDDDAGDDGRGDVDAAKAA